MKCIVLVLCLAVTLTCAEPPAYRAAKFGNNKSGKQELEDVDVEPTIPGAEAEGRSAGAPYPPSGWKPQGAKFELPRAGEETTPAAEYLPAAQYGPPSGEAVETTTTILQDDETTTDTPNDDESATLPPAAEGSGSDEKANLVEDVESIEVEAAPEQKVNDQGSYFVLLPDARIQRILYSVQQDPERLQFSSRLQSVGNQALTGPLVFFTPQYVQIV